MQVTAQKATVEKVNFNGKMITPLVTVNGGSLKEMHFDPLQFAIEKILPEGVFIIGGSGKIGNSWLTLDMCVAIATGGKLWDFNAAHGEVLYLALEDNYRRLQDRLMKVEQENADTSRLHLTTASLGIADGLLDQINYFLEQYPDTKFVVIDTLEHIRNGVYDRNMYSCDYRDMTLVREIIRDRKLTVFLVHHTRKMYDPDPLNTLSGSTGLVGAVDGVFVLEKVKRTSNDAKLTIANRDTECFCFKVRFDPVNCRWDYIGTNNDDTEDNCEDLLAIVLDDFLKDEWSGTATNLYGELKRLDDSLKINSGTIRSKLEKMSGLLKKEFNIGINFDRSNSRRGIFIKRLNG